MSSQRLIAVQEDVVVPSLSVEYEDAIKLLIRSVDKTQVRWSAAKHNQSYFYAFPIKSLNALDSEPGQPQRSFHGIMKGQAISSTRLSVFERFAAHSYMPASSRVAQPRFAFVDVHRVRVDQHDVYHSLVPRLVEAIGKTEYPFGWTAFRTVIGE